MWALPVSFTDTGTRTSWQAASGCSFCTRLGGVCVVPAFADVAGSPWPLTITGMAIPAAATAVSTAVKALVFVEKVRRRPVMIVLQEGDREGRERWPKNRRWARTV
ncbi:hypothetical protein GCM10010415_74520 [Streptomyces atrovirens]